MFFMLFLSMYNLSIHSNYQEKVNEMKSKISYLLVKYNLGSKKTSLAQSIKNAYSEFDKFQKEFNGNPEKAEFILIITGCLFDYAIKKGDPSSKDKNDGISFNPYNMTASSWGFVKQSLEPNFDWRSIHYHNAIKENEVLIEKAEQRMSINAAGDDGLNRDIDNIWCEAEKARCSQQIEPQKIEPQRKQPAKPMLDLGRIVG